jgi:hypothetical protein
MGSSVGSALLRVQRWWRLFGNEDASHEARQGLRLGDDRDECDESDERLVSRGQQSNVQKPATGRP